MSLCNSGAIVSVTTVVPRTPQLSRQSRRTSDCGSRRVELANTCAVRQVKPRYTGDRIQNFIPEQRTSNTCADNPWQRPTSQQFAPAQDARTVSKYIAAIVQQAKSQVNEPAQGARTLPEYINSMVQQAKSQVNEPALSEYVAAIVKQAENKLTLQLNKEEQLKLSFARKNTQLCSPTTPTCASKQRGRSCLKNNPNETLCQNQSKMLTTRGSQYEEGDCSLADCKKDMPFDMNACESADMEPLQVSIPSSITSELQSALMHLVYYCIVNCSDTDSDDVVKLMYAGMLPKNFMDFPFSPQNTKNVDSNTALLRSLQALRDGGLLSKYVAIPPFDRAARSQIQQTKTDDATEQPRIKSEISSEEQTPCKFSCKVVDSVALMRARGACARHCASREKQRLLVDSVALMKARKTCGKHGADRHLPATHACSDCMPYTNSYSSTSSSNRPTSSDTDTACSRSNGSSATSSNASSTPNRLISSVTSTNGSSTFNRSVSSSTSSRSGSGSGCS